MRAGVLTFLPKQGGDNSEKLQWIHINAVYLYGPVKMRSTDTTAGAAQTDLMTFCNDLAGNDLNLAQVGIIGEDTHAVVNDHDIAGINFDWIQITKCHGYVFVLYRKFDPKLNSNICSKLVQNDILIFSAGYICSRKEGALEGGNFFHGKAEYP